MVNIRYLKLAYNYSKKILKGTKTTIADEIYQNMQKYSKLDLPCNKISDEIRIELSNI